MGVLLEVVSIEINQNRTVSHRVNLRIFDRLEGDIIRRVPTVGHALDLGGRYLFPIWQQQ
jgi:hypothetical protein